MNAINNGFLNIRKEKGYTSHDVVAIVRKFTRTKVGHTGTLDPDATGVLPICLGRATKLAEYVAAADKTYRAEIIFGTTTNTGDISGEILTQKTVEVPFDDLVETAKSFLYENRGIYMQTPPMFSAIKIGGKKLYELARKGEVIDRPARPVKILAITALPSGYIEVTCTKGTYIRSLCVDIGEMLGCGATMGELVRTRSGNFSLENSISLAQFKEAAENGTLGEFILPPQKLLPYPAFTLHPEALARAKNGNPIPRELTSGEAEKCWLLAPDGTLIGLYRFEKNAFRAEVMM